MKTFNLSGKDFIPLCDLLKVVGLCHTGGEAKIMIAQGLVSVDDKVELRKRCKITPGQVVKYAGEAVQVEE